MTIDKNVAGASIAADRLIRRNSTALAMEEKSIAIGADCRLRVQFLFDESHVKGKQMQAVVVRTVEK
jgi:hypothetical protein